MISIDFKNDVHLHFYFTNMQKHDRLQAITSDDKRYYVLLISFRFSNKPINNTFSRPPSTIFS